MSVASSNRVSGHYWKRALDVPEFVLAALQDNQIKANCSLPMLQKARSFELAGRVVAGHFWFAAIFDGPVPQLICFLSIADTQLNTTYPACLFTPLPSEQFTFPNDTLSLSIDNLVEMVARRVSHRRIYSVFGPHPLPRMFAHSWGLATGVAVTDTYYDATLSFLPPGLAYSHELPVTVPNAYIGPAQSKDIPGIAKFCEMFAAINPPFMISKELAFFESAQLVGSNMVWVLRIGSEVASIVAFTRNTTEVATITKVFTNPAFRRRRFAECLVISVCRFLMSQPGRRTVALFVGQGNPAADVYQRAGFVGLGRSAQPFPTRADRWVEIGFDPSKVDLGHW